METRKLEIDLEHDIKYIINSDVFYCYFISVSTAMHWFTSKQVRQRSIPTEKWGGGGINDWSWIQMKECRDKALIGWAPGEKSHKGPGGGLTSRIFKFASV